jgi:gamma-glutamyltranspeptidase/glutathione hydrolase
VKRQLLVPLMYFCALGAEAKDVAAPRVPSGRPMVVAAAHPLAAQAGMEILQAGGDAVDAAIAVQAMLGLVEPQSSGLGGGAFMLRYDARTRRIDVYDGRETAPALADPRMFLDDSGRPLGRGVAMTAGRATGVPGVIAMLSLAHQEHGQRPWAGLFMSAAQQAETGFPVSKRIDRFVHSRFPQMAAPDARAYFTKADGLLVNAGDILANPRYAMFVRRLAAEGSSAFYQGEVAESIARRVAEAPLAGTLTTADIAAYRPVKRQPVCGKYRIYRLCSAPPPSSGVSLLQLMAMLERTDIARRSADDPQAWYQFAEASRIMYADRDGWIGDPAFSSIPVAGLLERSYVARRVALIGKQAGAAPVPGRPRGSPPPALDATLEPGGTSHFVVIDAYGNAVSMTTTVESVFGNGRMVHGFFLNNQLTDFSFLPVGPNAVAPGKRPRSSMSPVLILDSKGRLLGAAGSPGGNSILAYVAKTLVGALAWQLPMQQAIGLPNLVARGPQFNGEVARMPEAVVSGLKQRGVVIAPFGGEDSGIHGVLWRNGQWDGGADSRRDGVVLVETLQSRPEVNRPAQ